MTSNLPNLLRAVSIIANHRHDRDFQLTREDNIWHVRFRKNLDAGFMWVEVGQGSTKLEKALVQVIELETSKATEETERTRGFLKQLGNGK